jgi:hypothetical protein
MANVRDRLSVFLFAAFVLVTIVGGAFLVGYLVGRMIL